MAAKLILLSVILALVVGQITTTTTSTQSTILLPSVQPCLSFSGGNCIGCPYNYHIDQNQCYINITNCLTYSLNNLNRQLCSKCDPSVSSSDGNGGCTATVFQMNTVPSAGNMQDISAQYGDNRFVPITLAQALADPNFNVCNNYMLNGQWNSFISRTAQPIFAVSFFTYLGQNQYKILYSGSGGGLMMALMSIQIGTTNLLLNSFVPIGSSYVINYCADYDNTLRCLSCMSGYHLQGNYCYSNIGGCVSYSRNICLQCDGFSVLVENRCVGCSAVADLGKVVFYGSLFNFYTSNTMPYFSQAYLYGV